MSPLKLSFINLSLLIFGVQIVFQAVHEQVSGERTRKEKLKYIETQIAKEGSPWARQDYKDKDIVTCVIFIKKKYRQDIDIIKKFNDYIDNSILAEGDYQADPDLIIQEQKMDGVGLLWRIVSGSYGSWKKAFSTDNNVLFEAVSLMFYIC